MAVNVDGAGPSGLVRYYYTRQRVSLNSTSILTVNETTPGIIQITGTGNGTKITGSTTSYCTGCSFIATIQDGSPDQVDFEIDNGDFYSEPGGLKDLGAGDFSVTIE